ncbi:hypothetical protein E6O75_ATG02343 [Venturia nashicola]|uniref:Uncharacterized protein n=1 Tax=Venturia nashicola TaxID=86259 RepID=A0A4Z1P7T5_9PEZI|nr:hypothetical protein E6O75_ATG02343 [Venturia nashicola]
MDFLDAEERPDFTTTEYQETLELHRQSDFLNFFENEFEVAMEEREDLVMQSDLAIDSFTTQMSLTLWSKPNDTSMMDLDNESTMELHEDPPIKTKAPKGFLDLPRELRQAIIYISHESKEANIKNWYEAYKYVDWANVLRKVHPVVEGDMNYVEKCWNKRVVVWPLDHIPCNNPLIDLDVPNLVAAQTAEVERLRTLRERIKGRGQDPTVGSS